MSPTKDREHDGPTISRQAGRQDGHAGARVGIDEVAALLRDARRLTSTGGGLERERAAFLERKTQLLRRLEGSHDDECGGESR